MQTGASAKRVLITGASRGIGRAIADRFRMSGWEILAPTRADLELADTEAVARFARRDDVRSVDVLINNAGENQPLPFEDIELVNFERIMRVNAMAPYLLSRSIGLAMGERGWGRIVSISSVYALISRERRSMYTTSKSALHGMTKALAVELGPRGVLANAVCPGFVDTDLTRRNNTPEEIEKLCRDVPLRRLADPTEIADLVFFLGSENNTYITGQIIPIDGGLLCQ